MATQASSSNHSIRQSGDHAPDQLPADVIALGLTVAAPDCLPDDLSEASGADLIALALTEGEEDVTLSICARAEEDVEVIYRTVRNLDMVAAPELAESLRRVVRRLSRRLAVVAELHGRQVRALRGEPKV